MKSPVLGKSTSQVEVQDILRQGLWILVKGEEFFLSFKEYPWFKNAQVSSIYHVELLHHSHLYWPDLDIDLELKSLKHPKEYPLLSH
ncbi:MAG: DUF2442 domain-containing protein [Chlamydiae bacterium]|nr:DUF2442 domain-containing protein [Chlamydiota bacterium]MBI3277230.1 DUF2442 domain-containing protein [Chlamydiota bacterium]